MAKKTTKLNALEQRISDLKKVIPSQSNWRTTDEQEVARRQLRALQFPPLIKNLHPEHKIESNYQVVSEESKQTYLVEIRDLKRREFHSTSPDFSQNGLGTCKHTEAVLFHLQKRYTRLYREAEQNGGSRCELVVDHERNSLRILRPEAAETSVAFLECFDVNGRGEKDLSAEGLREIYEKAETFTDQRFRVSQEVLPYILKKEEEMERINLRRSYSQKVQSGEFPVHETKLPLFPYQQEGMLHLAFNGRAMVADEMGLGKTIQGIAAAALLYRLGKAKRCLIVCPASLKTEWEEQIEKFTHLPCQVVYGSRLERVALYENPEAFFIITNYEQVRSDSLDINEGLKPEIVILDEAQRIKNWTSQTAQAIKRLQSQYAFVLTGTPIENRIDELYSIIEFLDPTLLGSLFRFNRDYYKLNDGGRPEGYQNLHDLRAKVSPIVLRRRKADVETELPDRTDETRFIEITEGQKAIYSDYQEKLRRLVAQIKSQNRAPTKEERDRIMIMLGCMRMLCDTEFILDKETRESPKVDELAEIFENALADPEAKIIVFSEWVRMLELIRDHLKEQKVGFAWHTGSVPQIKRRKEIKAFKEDPECRVFLCTESGGAGLNLQNANYVINVDLPWNPAKLEQRIARAWRKGQKKPVQVINLVASGTIEHQMLGTIATKQGLADGVLDGIGDLDKIELKSGGQSFLTRLEQTLLVGQSVTEKHKPKSTPKKITDPGLAFAKDIYETHAESLLSCEEQFITEEEDSAKLLVVIKDRAEVTAETLKNAFLKYRPELENKPEEVEERLVIITESTQKELSRLQELGLVNTNLRARRDLSPQPVQEEEKTLTEEQKKELQRLGGVLESKLKSANVLLKAGLHDEVPALLKSAAFHLLSRHLLESGGDHLPEKIEDLETPAYQRQLPPTWASIYEQLVNDPANPYHQNELHTALVTEQLLWGLEN